MARERENANRQFRMHRRQLRDASDPFNMPEERFKELFRLSRELVFHLIHLLRPHLHQPAISVDHKFLATLRFYATGSYQPCVGQEYCFSVSPDIDASNCF
ncbi:hypothetical protein QE152_g9964 [Popillia japonica]|uniref:Uncharacterized protein n=1 Tax=Popillia japonica TaxID=7064 RepID=A0AAW1LT70_POPJA